MQLRYNAFISYRHHPDDIKVASQIHRALERFHVPGPLRKKTGKIDRLFRDKEELPITSNLTDDITRALENSDYLIVICSEHTCQSLWVQREIELFLQTHPRSKVLTVLASGEPRDTIPQILQYEQVVDPVTGQVTQVPIEPLSCDWRMPRRKALREELPRLAAALLNCGYDELRQRQRQYKTRKMVAGFTCALMLSLGLTGYFIHNSITIQRANAQIQENLQQSLKNQSQYLASTSQELLDDGDRLTAIALAMEALPSEGNPRPYVPEAELALAEALGIYDPAGQVMAEAAFSTEAIVDSFVVTDDGSTLYILDRLNRLSVWNTRTHNRLATIDLSEESVNEIKVTPNGDVLAMDYSNIWCYNPQGQLLWSAEDCVDTALWGEGTLLCIQRDFLEDTSRVLFLDVTTGQPNRESLSLPTLQEDLSASYFCRDSFESGQMLSIEYYDWELPVTILVDVDTGEYWQVDASPYGTLAVSDTQDGRVVTVVSDGSGEYNGRFGQVWSASPAWAEIRCMDTRGNLLWTNEIVTYIYSAVRTAQQIPGTELILCQVGNTFQLHNMEDGHLVSYCVAPGTPLTVTVEGDQAWGILDDGRYFVYTYENNTIQSIVYLRANAQQAQVCRGIFVSYPDEAKVMVYRTQADESWTEFSESGPSYLTDLACSEGLMALAGGLQIYLYDVEENSLLWSVEAAYSTNLLDFSPDQSTLWALNYKTLLCIDSQTGQVTTTDLPQQFGEQKCYSISDVHYADGQIVYLLKSLEKPVMVVMQLDTQEYQMYLLESEDWKAYTADLQPLALTGEFAWLWCDNGKVYRVELAGGQVSCLLEDLPKKPVAHMAEGRGVLISGDKGFLFLPEKKEPVRFSLEEKEAVAMYQLPQQLLILCNDGRLSRYSYDGKLLGRSTLALYNTFFTSLGIPFDPSEISWQLTGDGKLVLSVFGLANIIDMESWERNAVMENFLHYDPATDRLICRSGTQVGAYSRYTVEQLLQLGKERLNGFTLTQEEREYYGLS